MASKDAESMCTNCEDVIPFENIFKCVTCSDKIHDDPDQPLVTLCDGCVISHIKKNHKVNDNRGFEPSVCKEHKQLCSEFCKSCEKVCCTKCLRNHSEHKFEPLKEKASEIRSKVFEAVTEWELYEKPVRAKKELVSEMMRNQKEGVEKLIDYVEKKVDELKVNVVREIRSYLTGLEFSEKEIEDHIVKVGNVQQDFRSLLQLSEGAMVEKFPQISIAVKNQLELQKKIENMSFDDKNKIAEVGCLDDFFETAVFQIKQQLDKASEGKEVRLDVGLLGVPDSGIVENQDPSYFYSCHRQSVIEVKTHPNLSICEFSVDANAHLCNQRNIVRGFELDSKVNFVYYIDDDYILLLFEDKSTLLFSCSDGKQEERIDVAYPAMSYFLTPFISVRRKVEWVFWDAATKALSSTVGRLQVKCQKKPNNLLRGFSEFFGYFDLDTKKIITIERSGSLVAELIPFFVHGLNAVDCISYAYSYSGLLCMLLWSKESNLSVIFNKGSREGWVVKEKVDWTSGPVIESLSSGIFLIPKVYSASTTSHFDAFLVLKELQNCEEK